MRTSSWQSQFPVGRYYFWAPNRSFQIDDDFHAPFSVPVQVYKINFFDSFITRQQHRQATNQHKKSIVQPHLAQSNNSILFLHPPPPPIHHPPLLRPPQTPLLRLYPNQRRGSSIPLQLDYKLRRSTKTAAVRGLAGVVHAADQLLAQAMRGFEGHAKADS